METFSRGDTLALPNKVPEVTLRFWAIKILATTVGETAADFLNVRLNFGLTGTSLVMGSLLALTLVLQLRSRTLVPSLYWLVVVFVSVFGTLISDNLVDNLGVSLETTTLAFSLALAAAFFAWNRIEGTLSIREVTSLRRECFYWASVLLTFALGTSGGDLAAEGLGLGYATSALGFALAIAAVAAAHYVLEVGAIATFWIAYVLTRPLGASMGDLLAQPADQGGLGLGTVITSAIFLAGIVVLVAVSARPTAGASPHPFQGGRSE